MEISPRKPTKRAQEPVDEWLHNEGYFRKHAPRDPTCLFRAVSEQVYLTQYYHIRVRRECVEFMRKRSDMFEQNISVPIEMYLEQMACFTEWGGINEIQAMSLLYKRDFIVFNGQKQTHKNVTNNDFNNFVYLCHTPQKQYENIYTREFVATAAYCQSIVYQTLYQDVFQMPDIETTVHKMLHDRSSTYRHDKFFLKGNISIREELTTEIYNKVENGVDEVDEARVVAKGVPPFPYKVAKALDSNIYRNTDFDIWHEIRREVKSAGWTKYNSHELQIGGKCLVHRDYNEEEFDKANNNSIHVPSLEKDPNGNNNIKALQKKNKEEPVFLSGHIQEMSRNQGPVLVYIEELGEKRSVPYCALKPLPLKKNKQSSWMPLCKRNGIIDSNQKLKKAPYGTNTRKIKDSFISSSILLSDTDQNGNNNDNDANKNNFQGNQWKQDAPKVELRQAYENYATKKCPNYTVNNYVEIFPTAEVLDNQSTTLDNIKQEVKKESIEDTSYANHNSENSIINKASKCRPVRNNENHSEFNSLPKRRSQKETYYPPYSGNSHISGPNQFYIDSDNNSYSVFPQMFGNLGESGSQMDRMLRSINYSVEKSVDINGTDLPLSDPFTLRFFYNLGLEYFRGNPWNYVPNGQTIGFGQWYPGVPQIEGSIPSVTNGVMQDCTMPFQKDYNSNERKENCMQSLRQEAASHNINGVKDPQLQKTETSKRENIRDTLQSTRENMKDQAIGNKESTRINKNGLNPRFKKNPDNKNRNHFQQYNQQQALNTNIYQYYEPNLKNPKSQETKGDVMNSQHCNSIAQQVQPPGAAPNPFPAPYMQQGVFPSVPYYTGEADVFGNSYYPANNGFFPVPCLPHAEVAENNNVQPFSPHLWPGVDYAQAYPGLCPPYICPPPPSYNVLPQNMQEHWFTVPGQPHFMQYAPLVPVNGEGIVGQSNNQNALA